MPIVIQPYREVHEQAVRDFNQRLIAAGADPDLVFFTSAHPRWLPRTDGSSVFQEYFVALENDLVRGGYALKYQNFYFFDGVVRPVGYYHHPISEGIFNNSYTGVGAMLLKDAMNRSPLLYCLGMGGYDRPLPKMLMRLGWAHFAVPFYFYIVRPNRFLHQMEALRTSASRKVLLDVAAVTGTGWAGVQAVQTMRKLRAPGTTPYATVKIDEFSDWADPMWERGKKHCSMVAVRDTRALRTLYPATETHFTRLRVRRGDLDIGWAVVGERLKSRKYGTMRVGSIVDCWAEPQDALSIIQSATAALVDLGMDLIVSNQSHHLWAKAFEQAGFWNAASNFIFAAGKGLSALLQPFNEKQPQLQFTRADGDGLPHNF